MTDYLDIGHVKSAHVLQAPEDETDDPDTVSLLVRGEDGVLRFQIDEAQAFAFDDLAEQARRTIYDQRDNTDDE